MSLYRSCAYCGASLDPSEICDCQIELSELEERTSCKTHSLQKKKVVEEDIQQCEGCTYLGNAGACDA